MIMIGGRKLKCRSNGLKSCGIISLDLAELVFYLFLFFFLSFYISGVIFSVNFSDLGG